MDAGTRKLRVAKIVWIQGTGSLEQGDPVWQSCQTASCVQSFCPQNLAPLTLMLRVHASEVEFPVDSFYCHADRAACWMHFLVYQHMVHFNHRTLMQSAKSRAASLDRGSCHDACPRRFVLLQISATPVGRCRSIKAVAIRTCWQKHESILAMSSLFWRKQLYNVKDHIDCDNVSPLKQQSLA